MPRRAITVILHRDGALESRTIRVPLWTVRAAIIGGSVALTLLLLAVVLYGPIFVTAAKVPFLNREIARLSEENRQVQRLASTLQTAEERYAQVRSMLGGDVVPAAPKANATPLPAAHPLLASAPRAPRHYELGPSIPDHWPLEEPGVVTRGQVVAGGTDETHPGVDIAVASGTPIRASGGGVVSSAASDPEYGMYVMIDHPDGYQTLYGHASRLLVKSGDEVSAGQVIALSGSTGHSTGPHLHFEIRRGGRSLDPRSIVKEEF